MGVAACRCRASGAEEGSEVRGRIMRSRRSEMMLALEVPSVA